MPRTVSITYARLLESPRTTFDPVAGTGSIAVYYTVGSEIPEIVNADGSILGPLHIDRPDCANATNASVPLSATDTAGERLAALIGTILALEGLDPAAGDHCYDTAGNVLA